MKRESQYKFGSSSGKDHILSLRPGSTLSNIFINSFSLIGDGDDAQADTGPADGQQLSAASSGPSKRQRQAARDNEKSSSSSLQAQSHGQPSKERQGKN